MVNSTIERHMSVDLFYVVDGIGKPINDVHKPNRVCSSSRQHVNAFVIVHVLVADDDDDHDHRNVP